MIESFYSFPETFYHNYYPLFIFVSAQTITRTTMHTFAKRGAYEAPEAQVTDFELENSVLQSSTEDLFTGEPLN